MRLSELKIGESGVIKRLYGDAQFRRRLEEMGFIKGKRISVVLAAPLEDPIKYKIMGYEVSLRRAEASNVEISKIETAEEETAGKRTNETSAKLDRDRPTNNEATGKHKEEIRVALVGNPNCGKTSIFNIASGAHEHVGNYSGVTVDVKEGRMEHGGYIIRLCDLPGTYSLAPYSPEERYVRNYILEKRPDVVVNVVDSSNLERNLFLTAQFLDFDIPMVMALNMFDELRASGDKLDVAQLSKLLKMPIVTTVGRTGEGVDQLFDAVVETYEALRAGTLEPTATVKHGTILEEMIDELALKVENYPKLRSRLSSRLIAIKLLEDDNEVNAIVEAEPEGKELTALAEKYREQIQVEMHVAGDSAITDAKYGFIQGALREVYHLSDNHDTPALTKAIDSIVTSKKWGFVLFALFMYVTFYCTFTIGQYPMDWIDALIALLCGFFSDILPEGPLQALIVDGILSGVGSVIVFLPNILILYLFISFMEDSGYMARAAFIMDRLMHKLGLHGKSFIPMVMGFGCNIPAIMATRTIEDRKSRLLTILIIPLMSCSARLPVYLILIGAFFSHYAALFLFGLYFVGMMFAVIMAHIFSKYVVRGEVSPFVMELPPYRMPTLKTVLRHTWSRGEQYLRKMGTIILGACIIIWFLNYYPNHDRYETAAEQQEHSYLGQIGKAIEPVFVPCGFDWKQDVSILTGMAAKEIVASTLAILYTGDEVAADEAGDTALQSALRANLSRLSALCFLLFVLLYMPCLPAVITIQGETGRWRWALFVVAYTIALAWLVSTVVYQVGSLF